MATKTVSQAEFARLKDVSRKTVTQWKAKGLLSMTPDGMVKVEESEWLLADRPSNNRGGTIKAHQSGSARGAEAARPSETPEQIAERVVLQDGNAPHTHAEAARIKENYLALLRQLEYDQKRGAVVPIEDVAKTVEREYSTVRERLLSIPGKLAAKLVGRDRAAIDMALSQEINEALDELHDPNPDGWGGGPDGEAEES